MTLPMFKACVKGYADRVFDLQCIAVISGYYSGYYMSKKPKPLNVILESMLKTHERTHDHKKSTRLLEKDEMDARVKQFEEREARLRRSLNGK